MARAEILSGLCTPGLSPLSPSSTDFDTGNTPFTNQGFLQLSADADRMNVGFTKINSWFIWSHSVGFFMSVLFLLSKIMPESFKTSPPPARNDSAAFPFPTVSSTAHQLRLPGKCHSAVVSSSQCLSGTLPRVNDYLLPSPECTWTFS